jgi:hypothetical protein
MLHLIAWQEWSRGSTRLVAYCRCYFASHIETLSQPGSGIGGLLHALYKISAGRGYIYSTNRPVAWAGSNCRLVNLERVHLRLYLAC